MSSIPVTILAGYLGAGKTTLLNNALNYPNGKKYAVIVNEFGEIGIDHELIVNANDDVIEMNNGCICCTVREDLEKILLSLIKSENNFDGILIETTGLADPAPVAQTFYINEEIYRWAKLNSIVTIVDAKHVLYQIENSPEAIGQIAFADVILLNKIDIVTKNEIVEVKNCLQSVNRAAEIYETRHCEIKHSKIFERGSESELNINSNRREYLLENKHSHKHNHEVKSVCLFTDKPLDENLFNSWMRRLLAEHGKDLLRTKGILNIANRDEKLVVQAIHTLLESKYTKQWHPEEDRQSKLVFIGKNIDELDFRNDFQACVSRTCLY